ncbi:hypothetical protein BYT27DRAFT_7253093 [Phlegmacium glaucopus]|nr:hypothetical protein BYT27DRAFT_7253093 [Phlegmacium glaucopus]
MVVSIFWLVLAIPIVLYLLLLLAWNWLRQQLLAKETVILDLPLLGNPREKQDKIKGTAVICGGSISGLITAPILALPDDSVTVGTKVTSLWRQLVLGSPLLPRAEDELRLLSKDRRKETF